MMSGPEALPLPCPSEETHHPVRQACRPRCDPATSNLLPCRMTLFTKHLLLLHAHWGLMKNILGLFLAGLFIVRGSERRSWGNALVCG